MHREQLDALAKICVGCALQVHSTLGPGLLESVYKTCLALEIAKHGVEVDMEVPVPVLYDGLKVADIGFRMDLLVAKSLVIEVKSVEGLHPIHHAQLFSYLKLADKRLGLLLNFNLEHLRDGGIKRVVHTF